MEPAVTHLDFLDLKYVLPQTSLLSLVPFTILHTHIVMVRS